MDWFLGATWAVACIALAWAIIDQAQINDLTTRIETLESER